MLRDIFHSPFDSLSVTFDTGVTDFAVSAAPHFEHTSPAANFCTRCR